jgi:predicted nucleic acid-binding protein
MRDGDRTIVTNTTPLIALTAATGSLDVLRFLYDRVVVPREVADEVRAGGETGFCVDVFGDADWLEVSDQYIDIMPFLRHSLDVGEAAVIQTAIDLHLPLVCIDEAAGRRLARLCSLDLTGSIGVLIKASSLGYELSIPDALNRMQQKGIWLSEKVIQFALSQSR